MCHSRRRRRHLRRKCPSRARGIKVRISEWKNSPTSRWRPSMSSILTRPERSLPASSSRMAMVAAVMAAVMAAAMVAAMVAVAGMVAVGAAAVAAAAVAACRGAVARPSAKRQASRLCIKRSRVWSMRPDPLLSAFRRLDSSAIVENRAKGKSRDAYCGVQGMRMRILNS